MAAAINSPQADWHCPDNPFSTKIPCFVYNQNTYPFIKIKNWLTCNSPALLGSLGATKSISNIRNYGAVGDGTADDSAEIGRAHV